MSGNADTATAADTTAGCSGFVGVSGVSGVHANDAANVLFGVVGCRTSNQGVLRMESTT